MEYYYKKYSNTEGAWEVIELVKKRDITGNTAYRELVIIKNEWPCTELADEAQYLIDTEFLEYKFNQ